MANEEKKLSYEELEQAVKSLEVEKEQLRKYLHETLGKLKEYSDFTAFKRLDYLFKVVENIKSFSAEFVSKVIVEIEQAMYPADEEESKEEK